MHMLMSGNVNKITFQLSVLRVLFAFEQTNTISIIEKLCSVSLSNFVGTWLATLGELVVE